MLKAGTIFLIKLLIVTLFIRSDCPANVSGISQDTIKLNLTVPEKIDTNKFNVFSKKFSSKKIALVLSGGGARGIAQLGILNVFEKERIRPDLIVGTSIGSVLGGLYASGYSPGEIKNMLYDFDWDRALSLSNTYQRTSLFLEQKKIQDRSLLTIPLDGLTPVLLPSSFSNGQYLSEKINSYMLNARYHPVNDFSDLRIPFVAVATDLNSGRRIALKKGNLSESVRASFTFPLLYSPVIIDGKELVDGGLTANIPVQVAKNNGADLIIAVNSTSPLKNLKELNDPLNTADQILSITMSQLNDLQLSEAGIVLNPDIGKHSANNFKKFDYLINKGEKTASENADLILRKIDSMYSSESSNFNNFFINPKIEIESSILNKELSDTLNKITDKKFEKQTSIERNLRMIYNTGNFRNVYAIVTPEESAVKIVYHAESNPVLNDVELISPFKFLNEILANYKTKNIGKPINFFELDNLYYNILGAMRKNSYPAAYVKKFHFDYDKGKLLIETNGGNLDSIIIKGNIITKQNVISREVKFESRKPLIRQNVDQSIKNVMSTNLFGQVSFDFEYPGYNTVPDLKITVHEKNTKALRFTVKADNEKNLQLLIDLRDENLFGTGSETGILAAGGLRNRIYLAEIKSNQFFSLPLTFNLNAYYSFNDVYRYLQTIDTVKNDYSVTRTGEYRNLRNGGMSFLFGTQLERLGTIYTQGFFENQEIRNKSNSESITEKFRMLKLKFGGIFDTEDVLPFPTSGTLINFYYETAKNILEGELSYSKLFFSYEQYFTLVKSHVLKPRFIFGFADKTTPLTEQYYLGGQKSFFGMVENELTGRQILETSIEYRYSLPYKIFFDTYLSFRYDLGNIWQFTEDIRFKDLRHGFGLSAGFDTPLGEASFSVGKSFLISKGLTTDSFIFGPYDFYFSIGYDIY